MLWRFVKRGIPGLEELVLELWVGVGRPPRSAGIRSGREVWVEFGETHLYKHLGSVSLGPVGGAQGNKQFWFEDLTVLLRAQGKQGYELDGITHCYPPPLYVPAVF